MLVTVVFVLFAALGIIGGVAGPVLSDTLLARDFERSTHAYFSTESLIEDAVYRVKENMSLSSTEQLVVNGVTTTVAIADISSTEKHITARATSSRAVRAIESRVAKSVDLSFSFGAQAGEGGIDIENTGSIIGDAYSNGPIVTKNSALIDGTSTVSAGPEGIIDNAEVSGNAYAHTIKDTLVSGDAYYVVDENSSVSGTRHPDSPDKPKVPLMITDELIEQWKTQAEDGGVYDGACPYQIEDETVTIGPLKIPCNLDILGEASVSLAGPIWVEGNFNVVDNTTVSISGDQTIPVVVDDPSQPRSGGIAEIQNNSSFVAPEGTAIMVISQNTDGEEGGNTGAVVVRNGVSGDLIPYALHGIVNLRNNVGLAEVSGYKIVLSNSAQVVYSGGLPTLRMPTLEWNIKDWKEQ